MEDYKHELAIAYEVAKASKDPSTQVGAVILRDGEIVAMGFNRVMYEPHENKLQATLPAQIDAIVKAIRKGIRLEGTTLICPWPACVDSAKVIAACGISRVIAHKKAIDATPDRWLPSWQGAQKTFEQNNVELILYNKNINSVELLFDGNTWRP